MPVVERVLVQFVVVLMVVLVVVVVQVAVLVVVEVRSRMRVCTWYRGPRRMGGDDGR